VVSGSIDDLAYVSPKSGAAVSRAAATGYEARLLSLPPFLRDGGAASWDDIRHGLVLTGHFIERDLLHGRAADALAARGRLVDRMVRAAA
jgi:DNA repair protein RecO (recombination protein O)